MRVLHISQQFPSEPYPALGVMVRNSVRAVAEQLPLELLAPRPYTLPVAGFPYGQLARLPMRSHEHGYVVHRPRYLYLVPKPLFYPVAGPAMARACVQYAARLERPAIVHAHWSYPDGWAAKALAAAWGCRLVVHARGTLERVTAQQNSRFRRLVSLPLMAADAVIANSEALRDDCLALGVPAHKLHVIVNGIDLELFVPAHKASAKQRLGIAAQRPWLLFCGNLREVKGADLLAQAILQLRTLQPELGFMIVGGGELEAQLRDQLALALRDGSVLMPGPVPQHEVVHYMQAADLLLLPSRSEARANVLLEALACQTPVAAAAVGGVPELVKPEHGLLFEPGKVEPIVAAVLELMRDPARLRQLGAAGRRFAQDHGSSWREHATQLVELYRAL